MKKTLLVILFTGLLFSCSSDDDTSSQNNTDQDPIIGSWSPLKHVIVYANGSIDEDLLSSCEQTDSLTFFENGDLDMSLYYDYGNGCEIEITTIEGNWTKMNENSYFIYTKVYYDDDINDIEVDTVVLEVSFPENNVLYIHDEEIVEFYQDMGENVVDYYTLLNKN